jgi:hypothetical protein
MDTKTQPDLALESLFDSLIESDSARWARFTVSVETNMLAHGLNPDDDRDRWIYYTARIAELRAKEH